ncbi:MAG: DUF2460 domain-containing protein [Pseudomonadota bacterium]
MIAPFSEERFPVDLAFGSTGGPERQTQIVTLGSGREERNQRWRRSRRRFEAGYGVKTLDELHAVLAFFEARRGQLQGFRFRDPLDWKSCPPAQQPTALDQVVGRGDGVKTSFELSKSYGTGADTYVRRIDKPVLGTILIAVDGVASVTATADPIAGKIGFPVAPADGAEITAGFAFDVPVRFDTERLSINLAAFDAGEMPSVPLLEILL